MMPFRENFCTVLAAINSHTDLSIHYQLALFRNRGTGASCIGAFWVQISSGKFLEGLSNLC